MTDWWTAEVKEALTCFERLSLLQSKSYLQRREKETHQHRNHDGRQQVCNWEAVERQISTTKASLYPLMQGSPPLITAKKPSRQSTERPFWANLIHDGCNIIGGLSTVNENFNVRILIHTAILSFPWVPCKVLDWTFHWLVHVDDKLFNGKKNYTFKTLHHCSKSGVGRDMRKKE